LKSNRYRISISQDNLKLTDTNNTNMNITIWGFYLEGLDFNFRKGWLFSIVKSSSLNKIIKISNK
jgi:hypothetical protein